MTNHGTISTCLCNNLMVSNIQSICFVQLIQSFLFVATSKQYFTHYPLLQSIQNMSDYLQPTPQHQLKYRTTQNSIPSFNMWLVQLMEPIFPVTPLLKSVRHLKTEKVVSLKTALLHVHLISSFNMY